jgi:alpha-mannosidase
MPGFFTSRASSKGYIRWATSYLQAARQLDFLARQRLGWAGNNATDTLEEAVSLTQHHDAITGTAKQHVANDYNKRIAKGASPGLELLPWCMVGYSCFSLPHCKSCYRSVGLSEVG